MQGHQFRCFPLLPLGQVVQLRWAAGPPPLLLQEKACHVTLNPCSWWQKNNTIPCMARWEEGMIHTGESGMELSSSTIILGGLLYLAQILWKRISQ